MAFKLLEQPSTPFLKTGFQALKCFTGVGRANDDHQVKVLRKSRLVQAEDFPHQPAGSNPDNRFADPSRGHDHQPRDSRFDLLPAHPHKNERTAMDTSTVLPQTLEIRFMPEALFYGKPFQGWRVPMGRPAQADKRLRPLARRLARTLRPLFVELRLRNPNLRARRILEGR